MHRLFVLTRFGMEIQRAHGSNSPQQNLSPGCVASPGWKEGAAPQAQCTRTQAESTACARAGQQSAVTVTPPHLHHDSATEDLRWGELPIFTVLMKIIKPSKMYV